MHLWFHMLCLCCHSLFRISPSFGASRRPCFVIIAFSFPMYTCIFFIFLFHLSVFDCMSFIVKFHRWGRGPLCGQYIFGALLELGWDFRAIKPSFKSQVVFLPTVPLRKHAYSNIQCIENFTTKNWKFSDKNSDIFSYFCSKHRLWVLVRTASLRRF